MKFDPGRFINTAVVMMILALLISACTSEPDDDLVMNALRNVRRRVRTGVRAPGRIVDLELDARHWLAQRSAFDAEIRRSWEIDDDHTCFSRAVHAADGSPEQLQHELSGRTVHGLAGERELFDRIAVGAGGRTAPNHPIVRGGSR